ncbi:MAG: glycerophosphodiester phosphodiesterase family protein [Promethearchaeota archaeon]
MLLLDTLQKKKGKRWVFLYVVLSINLLIFLELIYTLKPYWNEINSEVSGWVGFEFDIVLLIRTILVIPFYYGLVLIIINIRRFIKTDEITPRSLNKVLPLILIILYNVIFSVLLYILDQYGQVKRILEVLDFYSIFLIYLSEILLIVLLYPIIKIVSKIKNYFSEKFLDPNKKAAIIVVSLMVLYIFAFIIPLIYRPSNVISGNLPPKPDLIVHRGASSLAPENTIEAGIAALDYNNVVGWEVDIRISFDGVPFLMHDETLQRTTDISNHFPGRENDRAETFSISELKELDAGSWFVEKDPFETISKGIVSDTKAESYKGIKIPTFEEVLNFTRDNNYYLDFDAYGPDPSHPYYDDFYEILLNMTIASGIDLSKIMIPTANTEWIDMINTRAPNILLGLEGSPSTVEFESSLYNYSYINTEDTYSNIGYRALHQSDIPVMVYVIDTKERHSQLWCFGVNWVKTNTPYKFNNITEPLWYMNQWNYQIISIIFIIAAISSAIIIKSGLLNKLISRK